MAEVPPFTIIRSPVLTFLSYVEFRLQYRGEHHSHNFPDGIPGKGHIEEHQPLLTTTTDFPDFRLDGGSSRAVRCFKSFAES